MSTKFFAYLAILGLIFLTPSFAQDDQRCSQPPPCIANSTLENAGNVNFGNMNSSPPRTVFNWFVSHGTPSFFSDVPVGGGVNSVWMWSYSGRGEGIYTCFNFRRGVRYRVCMWVRNTNGQNVGNLIVRAVNGMLQDFSTVSPNISPASAQLISNSYTYSSAWTFESYDFTANANYSQLQILPYRTLPAGSPAEQYELAVDLVSVLELPSQPPSDRVVECGTNVTVNSGVSQPCAAVEWSGPGGFYATGPSMNIPSITNAQSGTYEMRVSTLFGCVYTHNFNINVIGNCEEALCENAPDCIINGQLDAVGAGDLNTSATSTVNGWYVSHGTPTVMLETSVGRAPTVIWMWSYSSTGEGIFTCYRFLKDKRYRVCLDVRNTNLQNGGNLLVRAANNLTVGSYGNITPPDMQLISNSFTYSSSWTTVTYDFTADDDYNFLQLLPFRTGSASSQAEQYELMVDNISVIEMVDMPGDIQVRCGEDLEYNIDGNNCYTYEWFGPGGFYSSGPGLYIPNVNSSNSGLYTLNITSNTGNCVYSASFNVNVEGDCIPCERAELDIQFEGCNPVQFSPVSNVPGSIVSYYWSFGDGTSSTLANPLKYYGAPGVYEVCLTVVFSLNGETCCKTSCIRIDVCPPQVPNGPRSSSNLDFEYMYSNDNEVKITNIHIDKNYVVEDMLWSLDNITVSKVYNPFIKVADGNEICLDAQVAGQQGGVESVRVCKPIRNSKGISTGDFEIFPNPTDGTFRIKDPRNEILRLDVFSATGQLILTSVPQADREGMCQVDISGFARGTYMVKITTAQQSVSKMVILK
ncbi:MAG: hypothetical protein BGO09_03115 [Bacteroidetes bacterium 47-18]|nr:MAG: hypothetical protein BGO09_03115 [Bacteroidetes bacterium 47-18]